MKSSSTPESISSSSTQDTLSLVNSPIQPTIPTAMSSPHSDTPLAKASLKKTPKPRTHKPRISIKEISAMLADRAVAFCRDYLPGGHIERSKWVCSSIDGGEGQSFSVDLEGAYVGHWREWATGDHGDLVQLIQDKNGCSKGDAVKEAKKWLGILDGPCNIRPAKSAEDRNRELEEENRKTEEKHKSAAVQAVQEYEAAIPCRYHEYFQKKGVTPCDGIRINTKGNAVIPLSDLETGKITSLQYLLAIPKIDKRGKKRNKDFLAGGELGSFLIKGDFGEDGALCLCEGVATGLSISQYCHCDVLACISANNMMPVALKARKKWPNRVFQFCADNDFYDKDTGDPRPEEKNTGIVVARNCAKAVGGSVSIPDIVNGKCTDWNDYVTYRASQCNDQKECTDLGTELFSLILADKETYQIPSPEQLQAVVPVKNTVPSVVYTVSSPFGNVTAESKVIRYAVEHDEQGAADLYCHMFKDHLLFDTAANRWYMFKDHRWRPDRLATWKQCCSALSRAILKEMEPAEAKKSELKQLLAKNTQQQMDFSDADPKERKSKEKDLEKERKRIERELKKLDASTQDYDNMLHKLDTLYFRNNVGDLAHAGEGTMGYDGEGWDQEAYVLPCGNGVLDLKRGTLQKGNPSDRFITGTNVLFEGQAKCPEWEHFLDTCFPGKPEMISYLKRLCGYSACRDPKEQIFAIFTGTGCNGKSVFVDTLINVLGGSSGGIACVLQPEMLLDSSKQHVSGQARADLISLRGKAVAVASEANAGGLFNAATVKQLTGQDEITARPPFGRHDITFNPTHLLIFLTNALPRIDAMDNAMWRRVHLVKFSEDFSANPDMDLKHKLSSEYPGILKWIVEGAREWISQGLNPPPEVKKATKEYREDMDILGDFFQSEVTYIFGNEQLERDVQGFRRGYYIRSSYLFKAYQNWAEANGLRGKVVLTSREFGVQMTKRKDIEKKTTDYAYYKLKEPIALPEGEVNF